MLVWMPFKFQHVRRSLYNIPLDMPSFCSYKFTIGLKFLKYITLLIKLTETIYINIYTTWNDIN